MFSDLGRGGLFSSLTAATRDALMTGKSDSLLRTDRADESPLSDDLAADLDRIVADRRLLSGLTSRQRLDRDDLDELFARADELLETFEEKLLE